MMWNQVQDTPKLVDGLLHSLGLHVTLPTEEMDLGPAIDVRLLGGGGGGRKIQGERKLLGRSHNFLIFSIILWRHANKDFMKRNRLMDNDCHGKPKNTQIQI